MKRAPIFQLKMDYKGVQDIVMANLNFKNCDTLKN